MNTNESQHIEDSSERLPNIVLTNEPKYSEHKVDEKFNEKKKEFVPLIKEFIAQHELFRNEEEIQLTFAQKGVSSITTIIETPDRKLVLKIHRGKAFAAGEGHFLETWEQAGVRVPHVEESGEFNDHYYTIMEYIDAGTLAETYSDEEMISKGLYKEMGQTLRTMHTPKTNGFGFVVKNNPEFESVDEWLEGEDMKERFEYVEEHDLLGSLSNKLPDVLETIRKHSSTSQSTYCHHDFGASNIFATEPITVFDPSPKFNNSYYDIGLIQMGGIAFDSPEDARSQFMDGYFEENECDKEILNAYIFLACCIKFPYWHKTNREEEMKRVLDFLEEQL